MNNQTPDPIEKAMLILVKFFASVACIIFFYTLFSEMMK